jgi:serine/threonine protein kinase
MGLSPHSFGNKSQNHPETTVTVAAPTERPLSADASAASADSGCVLSTCAGAGQASAEAGVPAEWKLGDIILDLYEVKQIHAGGGMGLVYRAYHRAWNTDLAVKSPRTAYFQTEAQKKNFSRECETWIKLGLHPHMVSCYYVRKLGGIPRVFAEYVEGGSLKEWIDSRKLYEGGPYEALKRVLDIAIQMVECLSKRPGRFSAEAGAVGSASERLIVARSR